MIHHRLQMQFLLVLLLGAFLLSFFIFRPFLVSLVLAAVLAVVLRPLYIKILRYNNNRESSAALLTVFLSFLCILIPLSFLGTQIFYEAGQLYGSLVTSDIHESLLTTTLQNMGHTSEQFLPGTGSLFTSLSANLYVYAKQGLQWLLEHLGAVLSGITVLLLDLLIFFIALYYLLKDGPRFKKALISLSPLDDKDDEMIFGRLTRAVNSVIKGNLTISLLQGTLTAIGLSIFGVPNSILWGTLTSVTVLIPGIGTSMVLVPSILYLFATGHTASSGGLLLWGICAIALVENFLGPRLVGGRMHLHPLFVLVSVLGGIAFFGPIGIFLGPLTLSLLFALVEIYSYLSISQEPGKTTSL